MIYLTERRFAMSEEKIDIGCGCGCCSHSHESEQEHQHEHHHEEGSEGRELVAIIVGAVIFLANVIINKVLGTEEYSLISKILFIAVYLLLGGKILLSAAKNIIHGEIFDENFLMSIATLGALAIQEYPEAVGVMLFFRIGEFFEEPAVNRSRS